MLNKQLYEQFKYYMRMCSRLFKTIYEEKTSIEICIEMKYISAACR